MQSYRWLKSFRASKIYSSCLNTWNIPSTPPFPIWYQPPLPPPCFLHVSLLHQLKTNFICLSICHTLPLISSIWPCIQITWITANTLHPENEKYKQTPPQWGFVSFYPLLLSWRLLAHVQAFALTANNIPELSALLHTNTDAATQYSVYLQAHMSAPGQRNTTCAIIHAPFPLAYYKRLSSSILWLQYYWRWKY